MNKIEIKYISQHLNMDRNYKDPSYKNFRNNVRNRDKFCRWPNCLCKKKLQVHHILPWKTHPTLRYDENNGITLCKKHHKIVTGHELTYASFLKGLIF